MTYSPSFHQWEFWWFLAQLLSYSESQLPVCSDPCVWTSSVHLWSFLKNLFFFFNEYGNKWQKGAVLLSQRNFMYSTITFKSNPAITFWFVYLPADERDSVKWKSLLSVVCFRVFSHLRRSSSINGSFFLSVPCSRSPTYSSISSAFSMDRMYLGVENKHNYYLSNIKCMKKTMKKYISHAWIPKKTTNCNIRFSRPWNQD